MWGWGGGGAARRRAEPREAWGRLLNRERRPAPPRLTQEPDYTGESCLLCNESCIGESSILFRGFFGLFHATETEQEGHDERWRGPGPDAMLPARTLRAQSLPG